MRGKPRFDEIADLGGERLGRLVAGLEHHECLDDLGADRIGLADRGRERHRRVLDQTILDLPGADAITRRRDHVVVAADEMEISVLIDDALVARGHPVPDELLRSCFLASPILQEHDRVRPLHRDLAELARGRGRAVGADHRDAMARHRLADRARARDPDRSAGREHEVAFRLAVELVDDETQGGPAPLERLDAERFAAGTKRAQL